MNWITETLRNHPELAIYLTLGIGFLVGRIRIKGFSLGIVTSVLLAGVVIGQLEIPIGNTIKPVAFLLFLFAIGYKVGPQFFNGLKKDGLPQVYFAITMCLFILFSTWVIALIMGYDMGEAAGLLSGSQTISAVIGVAEDTINGLGIDEQSKQKAIGMIPVAYAVTYIFGTAGSAWFVSTIGPRLLGGVDKVKKACKELEKELGDEQDAKPGFMDAMRPVVFRAYNISNNWFLGGKRVADLENYFELQGKRLFVERIRKGTHILNNVTPNTILDIGDEVVLTGRREFAMGEEEWIGNEVNDESLLKFPVMVVPVLVTGKHRKKKSVFAGKTVAELRAQPFMHAVSIQKIRRMGISIPVFPKTVLNAGDTIELVGIKPDVLPAANEIGYPNIATESTDVAFMALGIFIGALLGTLTLHISGIPLSLSSSGGALIAGLFFGWWHSHRPTMGAIPEAALWAFNNLGLNIFIAVVGISAGPGFIDGLQQAGFSLFVAGAVATSLPLLFGIYIGRYWFKFHPAIALGCVCGARTTTAAIGSVQEVIESDTPALGYTVTYAVGNTLLILWGVFIVLMCS